MSRACAIRFDRKVTLALRALRHVTLKCCDYAHYGCARGYTDDLTAVIGLIVETNYTASLMLHYWPRSIPS